jgi:hypothetical protein
MVSVLEATLIPANGTLLVTAAVCINHPIHGTNSVSLLNKGPFGVEMYYGSSHGIIPLGITGI